MAYLLTHFWPGATEEQYRATYCGRPSRGRSAGWAGLPRRRTDRGRHPHRRGLGFEGILRPLREGGPPSEHARRRWLQWAARGAGRRGDEPPDGLTGIEGDALAIGARRRRGPRGPAADGVAAAGGGVLGAPLREASEYTRTRMVRLAGYLVADSVDATEPTTSTGRTSTPSSSRPSSRRASRSGSRFPPI